jgi:hypothetical protein
MSSSSEADEGTTADPLLLSPKAVITEVRCREDGSMLLYIEGVFEAMPFDCPPRPEGELLRIVVENRDGGPGTFIAEGSDAQAQYGWEPLQGTFALEVWASTHPSKVTTDLEHPSVGAEIAFDGVLDLRACTITNEAPCIGTSATE